MAVPPTIPTSFVPHSAAADTRRRGTDIMGAFSFIGYFIFALAVLSAIGAFAYDRILASEQSSKDAALTKAEVGIDSSTVAGFVRLRDRLVSGEALLSSHVALSTALIALGNVIPRSVRFSEVHLSQNDQKQYLLTASGIASSFNALADASNVFANDTHFKNAIFSGITIGGKSVSFTLTAAVDPSLIVFTPGQAATTTP